MSLKQRKIDAFAQTQKPLGFIVEQNCVQNSYSYSDSTTKKWWRYSSEWYRIIIQICWQLWNYCHKLSIIMVWRSFGLKFWTFARGSCVSIEVFCFVFRRRRKKTSQTRFCHRNVKIAVHTNNKTTKLWTEEIFVVIALVWNKWQWKGTAPAVRPTVRVSDTIRSELRSQFSNTDDIQNYVHNGIASKWKSAHTHTQIHIIAENRSQISFLHKKKKKRKRRMKEQERENGKHSTTQNANSKIILTVNVVYYLTPAWTHWTIVYVKNDIDRMHLNVFYLIFSFFSGAIENRSR